MNAKDRGLRDPWLLFPLATAGIFFASGNANFGFDPEGFLDSFMYLGYFWHYPDHLPVFDGYYKISRLPWILPGFAAHTVGGVIAGSYALGYASLALGACGLYLLVRDGLQDRTAAAICAIAFAGCTHAHGVGGWAYHMLPAGGYYLVACWLTVRAAAGPRPKRSAVASGVFAAAAVHTHLSLGLSLLIMPLLYCTARGIADRPWKIAVRDGALALGGAVALTAVLGGVNAATGGKALFFMPQIEHALRLAAPGGNVWWLGEPAQWLPGAIHLVLPAVFLLAGLPLLFQSGNDPVSRTAKALVAQGWLALAAMAYFQFARQQTMLDYPHLAFPLYLHAFPCLAAALARTGARERTTDRPAAAVTAVLLVLGALLVVGPARIDSGMSRLLSLTSLAIAGRAIAAVTFGIACLVGSWLLPPRRRQLAFAAWFAVLNAWVAPSPSSYGPGTPGTRQQMLSMFREADRFTAALDPTLRGIKYWIQQEAPTSTGTASLTAMFNSYVATRTWLPNLLGRTSPGPLIENISRDVFRTAPCIGVMSTVESQAHLQSQMQAHFERMGVPLEVVAGRRFETPDLAFALTVLTEAGRRRIDHEAVPPCLPLRPESS